MLTLRQLRYFIAVARHRHFGHAAEECAVSQPALSVQIRALEQHLGGALFERGRAGVTLTDLGIEIESRAQAILSEVRDLADHARHRSEVLAGPLKLGVIPSIAPYLLPGFLPAVHAGYPRLDLEIREAQTRALLAGLEEASLDVALLALPIETPRIETLALFEDRFLLLSPASRAAEQVPHQPMDIPPDDLLLLEDGHCMRDQTLTYCRTASAALRRQFGATSLATIVQMVANGYGSTLLPEISIPVELRGEPKVRVTRFVTPEPRRVVGLAWRASSPRRRDFEAIGKLLRVIGGRARSTVAD